MESRRTRGGSFFTTRGRASVTMLRADKSLSHSRVGSRNLTDCDFMEGRHVFRQECHLPDHYARCGMFPACMARARRPPSSNRSGSPIADRYFASLDDDRNISFAFARLEHLRHSVAVIAYVDVLDRDIFLGVILTGRLGVRSASFSVDQYFLCHGGDVIRCAPFNEM